MLKLSKYKVIQSPNCLVVRKRVIAHAAQAGWKIRNIMNTQGSYNFILGQFYELKMLHEDTFIVPWQSPFFEIWS